MTVKPGANQTTIRLLKGIANTMTVNTQNIISQRRASAAKNQSRSIDFTDGRRADELASEQAQNRGTWYRRLAELLNGVRQGDGVPDVYYRIGEFTTASGARTVIRQIERSPEKLSAQFDLEPRIIVKEDGKRSSELWAAVAAEGG